MYNYYTPEFFRQPYASVTDSSNTTIKYFISYAYKLNLPIHKTQKTRHFQLKYHKLKNNKIYFTYLCLSHKPYAPYASNKPYALSS